MTGGSGEGKGGKQRCVLGAGKARGRSWWQEESGGGALGAGEAVDGSCCRWWQ